MHNGNHLQVKGLCRKLDETMSTSFQTALTGHNNHYCKLNLPADWNIDPIFIISLLDKYRGKNPEGEIVKIETDDDGG
jgi:hypothetical protein